MEGNRNGLHRQVGVANVMGTGKTNGGREGNVDVGMCLSRVGSDVSRSGVFDPAEVPWLGQ